MIWRPPACPFAGQYPRPVRAPMLDLILLIGLLVVLYRVEAIFRLVKAVEFRTRTDDDEESPCHDQG